MPFRLVHVMGDRALFSGHGPTTKDGAIAAPLGKVGAHLTEQDGYAAAQRTALAVLASLKQALGELDQITAWGRILVFVNSAAGFNRQSVVANGFSELICRVFGTAGSHARSAVGVAELPFDFPVEVEGEVYFRHDWTGATDIKSRDAT